VIFHDTSNTRPLLDQLEETMASTEKLRLMLQSMLAERDWATAQNNLGAALREFGKLSSGKEGRKQLEEAAAALTLRHERGSFALQSNAFP
jgi:hypothetical protein